METTDKINEFDYIQKLYRKIISEFPDYNVFIEKKYDKYRPDISIEFKNKVLLFEVKNSRSYSSLPFSTILQLEDYKTNIPNSEVVLISLSSINEILQQKLNDIEIQTLVKPQFETIIDFIKKKNIT
ncbi:hypothetical protein [Flavobacterium sp. CAU 1735]|uniref:hypothetical protein n=1 Tax=Flavobacterium sp. CAU 1735 TaxID=3140361 RepID=UPI00325FE57E